MRAVCRTRASGVEVRDIAVPDATREHVVVRISACGINPGDKAWIAGAFPEIPASRHDICGATACGVVVAAGEGVPQAYFGRKVAVYRSLKASDDCVGVWSEYARLHYLNCLVLPDDVDETEYAASLVSNVTAYVFFEQMLEAGHQAFVATAGTSATGRSLLGVCRAWSTPIVCLTRTEQGRALLAGLDADHVLVASDPEFDRKLATACGGLNATAVFDGVGGKLVGRLAKALPAGSTVHCYGFLAGPEPLELPSSLLLMKSLTLTSFSVLRPLMRDAQTLKRLLAGLEPIIAMPQFRTLPGKSFRLEQAAQALNWSDSDGLKVLLRP